MTAFPGAGDALDRIGGRVVLETLLSEVGDAAPAEVVILDTPTHYLLVLELDGRRHSLREVALASSNAINSEALALLVDDLRELFPVVAEIRTALAEARIPETERRALHGDR